MAKRLIITEKKSVADDFARVLGKKNATGSGESFRKSALSYESDGTIIAWASGHLLELAEPGSYDKAWKFWTLEKLPIIPKTFVHQPRTDNKKTEQLLKNLIKLIRREDVSTIINGCDAGREGELIFNLILDHARSGRGKTKAEGKDVQRLWLQSMTTQSILKSFGKLESADEYAQLQEAAYTRDQADWLVGMNGTRALTKRFLGGRSRQALAVGRVKTPTLAFLVDRERQIDNFIPVAFFQLASTFLTHEGTPANPDGEFEAWWVGKDANGKSTDRLSTQQEADDIVARVQGKVGKATDTTRRSKEKPPQLFDLTTLQRKASSAFGFTLKRTLSIAQTLYEKKKAITYPRTGSRYLPNDYTSIVPDVMSQLSKGGYRDLVSKVPNPQAPQPERAGSVFDDAKVGDHFALIPTGEVPRSLREDEQKIYDLIVRRFLAAFMPSSERESITRRVEVEGEAFKATARRLVFPGWRGVEPSGKDDPDFPTLKPSAECTNKEVERVDKETTPPGRYSDGSLVGEMETCGKHVEDEEEAEALKESGIGTPATRASIVEDLIYKGLARRDGRTLIPTDLGSTLVRIVRNLDLESLAKPDLTGKWERRLKQIVEGTYDAEAFRKEIIDLVSQMVAKVKGADSVSEVFAADHPKGIKLLCPLCQSKLIEKAYSYFCSDEEGCAHRIQKNMGGKHLFPEILARVLAAGGESVGPFTGVDRPKAPCKLKLIEGGQVELEPEGDFPADEYIISEADRVEDGVVMGKCPKCEAEVVAQGEGFKCASEKCRFRLSKRLLFRVLPPDDVRRMLSGPNEETSLLEGFISRRGRPFAAHLFFDEKGGLKWKFPPRPKKKTAKKKTKKKAKKKSTKKKSAKKS